MSKKAICILKPKKTNGEGGKMVEFAEKQQEMDEIRGFTVYDAESGEPANVADAVMQPDAIGMFAINENGKLIAIYVDGWHDTESVVVQKLGNYIIQFGSGEKFRW